MTPKLRLRDDERKTLLSCIRKLRFPGMHWMIRSTQMMLEPMTQAAGASVSMPFVETSSCCPTDPAYAGHDPSACIIIERHLGCGQTGAGLSVGLVPRVLYVHAANLQHRG